MTKFSGTESDHHHGSGPNGDDLDHTHGVPSRAAIGGHPVHPMLVAFPIVFLVAVFGTDVAYLKTGDPFWARASLYLALAGLGTGTAAAFAGFIDFATIARARVHLSGWVHFVGNFIVLVLALVSVLLRIPDAAARIWPWSFLVSSATAALLLVTGWCGGELVFRHMIGVTGHGPEHASQSTCSDLDPEFLRKHSEFDHHLFGWAAAPVVVLNLVHSFTTAADALSHWWPLPWLAVSLYFACHTEPDIKQKYPSWIASWADHGTREHRIISIGGVLMSVVELGTMNLGWHYFGLWTILPVGQVASGLIFLGHHHADESPLVVRQHQIITAALIAAGTALGAARLLPALAPLGNAWPWLVGILAYLYITYTEQLAAHEHAETKRAAAGGAASSVSG